MSHTFNYAAIAEALPLGRLLPMCVSTSLIGYRLPASEFLTPQLSRSHSADNRDLHTFSALRLVPIPASLLLSLFPRHSLPFKTHS
jgi:hypothetical protein